jgi:hypothetical protein
MVKEFRQLEILMNFLVRYVILEHQCTNECATQSLSK